jgi:hypothetical protein
VPFSKHLARAHELLQKLADQFDNSPIIWDARIEQDLRAVAAELDNAAKSIQDPDSFSTTSYLLLTLNVLLRYDDHWGALFKRAESGQTELITKVQLWIYRALTDIPDQSPSWEIAEFREGKEDFEAWHSLWRHRRGETEKEKSRPLPDQLSTSSGGSETLEEKGSVTGRTDSHSHSGTVSDVLSSTPGNITGQLLKP